ncbi:serine--tRNA ligase [Candidatus Magnetaquicoccus inordinatus]|uniref:serine--tRNA ligase n=1 Tax=Candidatus Magnetaquicoccus inordinatus TaxID=2496818 RepID=UPI00102D084C|nr:serine--tRNA ligase [Candidatus Magnetaquicoccus inordinatus]
MLDLKKIRDNPQWVEERLASRGRAYNLQKVYQLEAAKRALQTETENLQARRNAISRQIGQLKGKGQDVSALMAEMVQCGPQLQELQQQLATMESELLAVLAELPNLPDETVPLGRDEQDNLEICRWPDEQQPARKAFEELPHWEIGQRLGILDFDAGILVAGARFTVLRGAGARLNRALIQFMLDLHSGEHGYTEIMPPFLVNRESLFGTGQLPKFEEELFAARDDALFLIPTAEVPVTNLVRGEIIEEERLPLKFVAWTSCFRREAGAAGRDTRGLIRQHQFDKVELVWITRPEESGAALEQLTRDAEQVLQRLELPYRRVALCTGDLGFASCKTYDLEVWLPGQGCYREISSCSNTGDFQARRMQARLRRKEGRKVELLHTLNGSGIAVGRTLVALLENFQQADGSVVIPDALRPYMGGVEILRPQE